MTRAILRLALLLAPPEFRDHYGVQIGGPGERGFSAGDIADLAVTGLRLRWEDFVRDFTYALRRLSNAPLFVSIVVLTFALGIGANVAVFSVLDAVVLKPLPFKDPNGIVVIFDTVRSGAKVPDNLSLADPLDMRSVPGVATTTALASDGGTMLARNKPFAISGLDVIPDYFNILGITAELGRVLAPTDGDPGMHDIVISDEVWRARFNADPSVIGETVRLNGIPERIVGVLRASQPALDPNGSLGSQDYYAALPEHATFADREQRYLAGFARLVPGASIANTNAQLALLSARLQKLYPKIDHERIFSIVPARSELLSSAASALWIIFAAVVGILLIACANVGNLLGARWSTRDRELAVRRALGASSRRIGIQLLIEAGVLATIGATAGVALAYGALHALAGLLVNALPRASTVHIDGASLLYAIGVVTAATLLAGVAPLLSLGNPDLQGVLKTAGRGGDASSHHRLRSTLVVLEIALALALVVVSGLTVRSFVNLINTPLGVRPNGVIASGLTMLPEKNLGTLAARAAAQRDLLARLQALPGVKAAALAALYPLGPLSNRSDAPVFGRTYPIGSAPHASANNVTSDYFRVLGIPLLRGRMFDSDDTMGSASVAIVNEAFVQRYLQSVNPIGVRIQTQGWNGTPTSWSTIVGVVGDERDTIAQPPYPGVFVPMAQGPAAYTSALVYAPAVDAAVTASEMKGAFDAALPTVQPPDTYTVAQLVAEHTAQERFATILLTTLACIALALALSGIFGVISFSVTQRKREFGVRMALGATEPAVLADVLRRTLVTTAIGVAVGVIIAAFAARAIASQLGSISPFDPLTFGVVVLLIFCSAMLASLHPALRATRIQPVEALRYE
jgi:putative ABC transport system permease protein